MATSSQPMRKYHGRGRSGDHIPRPPNAFLLFRSDFIDKGIIPSYIESKQQNVSRIAAEVWRQMSKDELQVWKDKAQLTKEKHRLEHPDFKFKPTRRGPIKRRRQSKTREEELLHCDELIIKYLPDKAGPISRNRIPDPNLRRESNSNPLSSQSPSPPGTLSQHSLEDGPVFMEPLVRPASIPAPTSSQAKHVPVMEYEGQETATHQFVFYHPSPPHDTPPPPSPRRLSPYTLDMPAQAVTRIKGEYTETDESGPWLTVKSFPLWIHLWLTMI